MSQNSEYLGLTFIFKESGETVPTPAPTTDSNHSLFYPEKVHDEIAKVTWSTQPRRAHGTQMPYTDAVFMKYRDLLISCLHAGLPQATTTNTIFKNYYIPKVRV